MGSSYRALIHRRYSSLSRDTKNYILSLGAEGAVVQKSYDNLKLAINFLNFKPLTLREAYQQCRNRGMSIIRGTLWLLRDTKSLDATIFNGEDVIGTLNRNLKYQVIKSCNEDHISLRVRQRLLSLLMEK